MTENEPKLEVGDFARNKIHGYITFLYGTTLVRTPVVPFPNLFFAVCVELSKVPKQIDYIQEGFTRLEIPSELEQVFPTLSLITKAKEYLLHFNTAEELDNLSYIECLNKLVEKEKELKNENQL